MIPVLIPAYQPDHALPTLVKECQGLGLGPFVVVNDGSSPDRQEIFSLLEQMGCTVLCHEQNRGKGAALKTGLQAIPALFPSAEGVVSADADGQHRPEDIAAICRLVPKHSAVLGVRELQGASVPFRSRFGNRLSATYFRLLTGVACPDTQTGLRGFSRELFPLLLSCSGERYDYEMNVLTELCDCKLALHYHPIQTVYLNKNAASHFRPIRDSLRIYRRSLRFVASSLSCSVVDLALFFVLSLILQDQPYSILLSTVIARLVSGVLNFTVNKKWSFSSKGRAHPELLRYGILFVAQMLTSYALVQLLTVLPAFALLWKIPVDCLLFFLSFFIQRRWVYRKEETDA